MSDHRIKPFEVQARRALKPPFTYHAGYIHDADGHMVADESGHRIRGWGRLGAMEDGAEVQDAIGQRIAEILTKYWNQA